MKRANTVLGFLLILVLGLSLSTTLAEANPVRLITIESDGSVVPQTEYIKKEGNVYYLTQSLSPARLVINCSNIVFDGQGYTIDGSNYFVLGGKGITLENVNNVTIRDVIVVGFYEPSISLYKCTDITILRVQTDAKPSLVVDVSGCIWIEDSNQNTICNCATGIRVQSGSNNTIYGNNVTLLINSPNNLIYYNNIDVHYYGKDATPYPIILLGASTNRWDNGSVGNYWSNYNGQRIYELDENNIDHYPLVSKISISTEIPSSSISDLATPAPTATPILTPAPSPTVTANPTPTQSPTSIFAATPTASATVPEFLVWVTLLTLAVAGLLSIVVFKKLPKATG